MLGQWKSKTQSLQFTCLLFLFKDEDLPRSSFISRFLFQKKMDARSRAPSFVSSLMTTSEITHKTFWRWMKSSENTKTSKITSKHPRLHRNIWDYTQDFLALDEVFGNIKTSKITSENIRDYIETSEITHKTYWRWMKSSENIREYIETSMIISKHPKLNTRHFGDGWSLWKTSKHPKLYWNIDYIEAFEIILY